MTDAPAPPNDAVDPPLDRTISPIAGPLTSGRGKMLAFAGLLLGCGAVALATWSAEQPRRTPPRQTPARQVVAYEPAKAPPTLAEPGMDAPRLDRGSGDGVPALEPLPQDASRTAGPAGAPSPQELARRSPLMAYSRGGLGVLGGNVPPAAVPALAGEASSPPELEQLRRSSGVGRASAAPVGDRNYLILAGTTLPCVLQTAVDTTTAGYVTCLIDHDVHSDNGAVVLFDKGSRVLGEYRTGMRQGQSRVFVLWTRAVTPRGVAIALASPASDALGRAGFGGAVDTHFWDRFGAAILLSIIDGGAAVLTDHDGAAGSVRLPSDAAGLAVRQGGDIAPTLRTAQGSEVAIQVAQDLDFSSVYGLRARP